MKRLSRLAAMTVYVLALFSIWLLGGSKYAWMSDLDPTYAEAAIETDGSRDLVATLLLVIAFLATAFLAASGPTRGARVAPLFLAILAVVLYVVARP
ncbi:hypothetical protein [Rhizobium rhizophilum]|uniref:Uncharacterized protein n=1 Tax=Rhizobium rhizophilum TaxID=1850373 RepID=A0ABY2QNU3_9HYPH|nr:hypothetical protein [Rhizobium rhizophilum]THV11004.1 hypothetical protein E9677_21860 [Rhizobium rhizophilum]